MRRRLFTRALLVPAGLLVVAVGLGLLVFPGSPERSSTTTMNTELASSVSPSTAAQIAEGRTLFESTCSSCHGPDAEGSALAPNLRGVGAATVDLWVSSGWMPLASPTSSPLRKPSLFSSAQTVAIADFIESLAGGPTIPKVDLSGASVSQGFSIFALNCAPCHTITGAGDALSNGIYAPPLHGITNTQVAEAVRTGPGNMPRFGPGQISNDQLNDVIAYVTKNIEHPDNPGGLGLGGVGPVAEGFVGLFGGVGACALVALWIGDRSEPEDKHGNGEGAEQTVAHG